MKNSSILKAWSACKIGGVLGRRADAISALEAALRLDPGHVPATRELRTCRG